MRNGIKEVEDLFDVPLIDAAQADALLGKAKELLLIANLRQARELAPVLWLKRWWPACRVRLL